MKWGGPKAKAWTAAVLAEYGTTCHLRYPGCTVVATEGDHLVPISHAPELALDVSNGRPACRHCNAKRGARLLPQSRPRLDLRRWFA